MATFRDLMRLEVLAAAFFVLMSASILGFVYVLHGEQAEVARLMAEGVRSQSVSHSKGPVSSSFYEGLNRDLQARLKMTEGKAAIGMPSESCSATCARVHNLVCSPRGFNELNSCVALRRAFADASIPCSETFFGTDLPALQPSTGSLLTNSKLEYTSGCEAAYSDSVRLCPCNTAQQASTDVTMKIKPTVIRALVRMRSQKDARGSDLDVPDPLQAGGGPPVEEAIEDLESGRVQFVTASAGVNCYDTCRSDSETLCQRHWFELINTCDVMKAVFPEFDKCETGIFGRDLPALRRSTKEILVNSDTWAYSSSCGNKHELTERLCPCGRRKGGSSTSETWHTVFNVQATRYFEWQVRYSYFWKAKAGHKGAMTRLLSASQADHLMSEIPTHVAPPWDMSKESYLAYNKPLAVDHWMQKFRPKEDNIMIIDPDCMFIRPANFVVEKGRPIAQQAFYYFSKNPPADPVPMQIYEKFCKGCTFVDPIAVPIIIHRDDIAKIAPLWFQKTHEIRKDIANWPSAWKDSKQSKVGLDWTAEMFGYVFAAAQLGIRHDIWDFQVVPPVHKTQFAPIIHYHVEFPVGNDQKWFKQKEDAAWSAPWPLPSGLDEVTNNAVTNLHEAWVALGKTGHEWKGGYFAPEV